MFSWRPSSLAIQAVSWAINRGAGRACRKATSVSVWTWIESQPRSSGWRITAFQAPAHRNSTNWTAEGSTGETKLHLCHHTRKQAPYADHTVPLTVRAPRAALGAPKGVSQCHGKCPWVQGQSLTFIPLVCLRHRGRGGLAGAFWSPSTGASTDPPQAPVRGTHGPAHEINHTHSFTPGLCDV